MSSDPFLTALILAGSRAGARDPVAEAGDRSVKAFVPVDGVPMIERVIEALLASEAFSRLVIALPDGLPIAREAPRLAAWLAEGRVERIAPEASPSRSVSAALETLKLPLFVTTADHALLTKEMIAAFLAQALAAKADVAAALVPLGLVQQAYPQTRRTRLMFRDGGYSGCNMFLFCGPDARRVAQFWQRMEAHRKQPLRMIAQIGPLSALGFVLKRWSFAQVIDRLSKKIGARLTPILLEIPEAAIDVDTPEDWRLAGEILRKRRQGR